VLLESMSDFRDFCEHKGRKALECFESYVSGQWVLNMYLMESDSGKRERDRVFELIEDYRQKIESESDENLRWHMFEEFRSIS
jgi:hypothetical protein